MRTLIFLTVFLMVVAASLGAGEQPVANSFDPQQIVSQQIMALERGAIDRWGKGDTQI